MARSAEVRAEAVFREHGGVLRTSEALAAGINPVTLYRMIDDGRLDKLTRGVYQLADGPGLQYPDLVAVQRRVPRGVVCLISALAFHELTDQIPHAVHMALPSHARKPQISYPPTSFYWFSDVCFAAGIETHQADGTELRVYGRAKTVADAFKFRGKIGRDVALEALHFYMDRPDYNMDELVHYAKRCRVFSVMRPYMEALV